MRSWAACALAAGLGAWAGLARAEATAFRLPLADYPIADRCLDWGDPNPNFQRCDLPGLHVADDACVPNRTAVLAVADGHVRYASVVGDCADNWGWVMVVEHVLQDASRVCSIYGHCAPQPGLGPGTAVAIGAEIAAVENLCLPHIHFGIYTGGFATVDGMYPEWLTGYLPAIACGAAPSFPGAWVDPVRFVLDRVAVAPNSWGPIKLRYR